MTKWLRPMSTIFLAVGLIVGSSLAIPAQFQDEIPAKNRHTQNNREQQEEGQPAPELIEYWQSLIARNKEPLAAMWNKGTGTPKSIVGKLSPPTRGATESSARSFLVENARLFKMRSDTDDLDLARSSESPLGRHFIFEQHYRGVLVYGAQVGIHFNRDGEIVTVNNTYQPEIALESVKPTISRLNAIARALAAVRQNPVSRADAGLMVVSFNNSFRLSWRIVISTDGPTWEIFVDAQNGQFLSDLRDINRYANGFGQVFIVNAVVATRDNTLRDNLDAASAVPFSAYTTVILERLLGNGFLDGMFASSSATKKRASNAANNFIFDRSQDGFSETMGYYYIDFAERYIQSLGFTNVNNRQQVFAVNRLKIDNSFYSPNSKEISLGLGGVDDAEDAEVILHEYGHSIQDNQVPGFGTTLEAGAMGEGFGDYWAASVGAQFSGGFQDLCLADWDATSYSSSNPPCLRRLDGTKHYPEDVDGEVHDDGEIWSAALWEIRGSLGATDSDRVIIAAHFLLAPSASFNQGANALVTAALSLGFKNHQVNVIRNILRNRGFTVMV
jgi:Zn-dependent metalloprotease